MKEFDLNIEKVLENWTVAHAIRELIANALDEQILTDSADISIYRDATDHWHIRDYGRGLRYQHLTQNENEEKQNHPHLIGKFGVGLKDALATFDRNSIGVTIDSKHGHITIGQSTKHGFSDITTLHAYIDKPLDKNFAGTDICLAGCSEMDIRDAKKLFLRFMDIEVLETTEYGDVLDKRGMVGEIFINGIARLESLKQDIKGGSIILVIFLNLTGANHLHDHGEVLLFGRRFIMQIEHESQQQHGCSLIPEGVLALRALWRCVLEKVGNESLNIIVVTQIYEGVIAVALGHVNEIHNADVITFFLQQVARITQ